MGKHGPSKGGGQSWGKGKGGGESWGKGGGWGDDAGWGKHGCKGGGKGGGWGDDRGKGGGWGDDGGWGKGTEPWGKGDLPSKGGGSGWGPAWGKGDLSEWCSGPDDMCLSKQLLGKIAELKGEGKGQSKDKDKGKSKGKGKGHGQNSGERQPAEPGPRAKASSARIKDASGLLPDLPWKSRLLQAWGKKEKRAPTKEDLVWTTEAVEGGFICVLTCKEFSMEYETDRAYEQEKHAVACCSMLALETEYPEAYALTPQKMRDAGAEHVTTSMGGIGIHNKKASQPQEEQQQEQIKEPVPRGEKRKREKGPPHANVPAHMNKDPKSLLNVGLLILAGQPTTKQDVDYQTEVIDGKSVCTLTIRCFPGDEAVFEGEAVGPSKEAKKVAENKAAEAALKVYQDQIDEETPLHEERKRQRKAEREAKDAERKREMEEQKAAEDALS